MDLYQQLIMDHYRNPRHRGTLANPDITSELHNPSCGDSVSWQVAVEEGAITTLAFLGTGCVISQACASLLADYCHRKRLDFVMKLDATIIVQLTGTHFGPVRLKCALLPLEALQHGIGQFLAKKEFNA